MKTTFSLSQGHYEALQQHLFPGDGKEAVAVALCGRNVTDDHFGLTIFELLLIPYDQCITREPDFIHWPASLIKPLLEKAMKRGMSIAKIHCHPGGGRFFSKTDNESDRILFDSVFGWVGDDLPHASLVMLPDGSLFGRFITTDITFQPIDRVRMSGDEVYYWDWAEHHSDNNEFDLRNVQTFGKGTVNLLKKMRVGIIGCSGTGSPLAVQLGRLGIGELGLIDPDHVEIKNLNRIAVSFASDIGRKKTEVLQERIHQFGSGTQVYNFPVNLYDDKEAIAFLKSCDFIFGCVDSVDGRHLINRIATFYLIPYIDVGVKLIADGTGGIDNICFSIHYLIPGQSLLARKLYSVQALSDASLQRGDPEEFEKRLKEGYVRNAPVESPAVVHVNTKAASCAVEEFLARIHHYRFEPNTNFNIQQWEFIHNVYLHRQDTTSDLGSVKYIGRGDMAPLLNMPELT